MKPFSSKTHPTFYYNFSQRPSKTTHVFNAQQRKKSPNFIFPSEQIGRYLPSKKSLNKPPALLIYVILQPLVVKKGGGEVNKWVANRGKIPTRATYRSVHCALAAPGILLIYRSTTRQLLYRTRDVDV